MINKLLEREAAAVLDKKIKEIHDKERELSALYYSTPMGYVLKEKVTTVVEQAKDSIKTAEEIKSLILAGEIYCGQNQGKDVPVEMRMHYDELYGQCIKALETILEEVRGVKRVSDEKAERKREFHEQNNFGLMIVGAIVYGIGALIATFIVGILVSIVLVIISLGGLLFDPSGIVNGLEVIAFIISGIGLVLGGCKGLSSKEVGDLFRR